MVVDLDLGPELEVLVVALGAVEHRGLPGADDGPVVDLPLALRPSPPPLVQPLKVLPSKSETQPSSSLPCAADSKPDAPERHAVGSWMSKPVKADSSSSDSARRRFP